MIINLKKRCAASCFIFLSELLRAIGWLTNAFCNTANILCAENQMNSMRLSVSSRVSYILQNFTNRISVVKSFSGASKSQEIQVTEKMAFFIDIRGIFENLVRQISRKTLFVKFSCKI